MIAHESPGAPGLRAFRELEVDLTGVHLVEASAGTGKTYAISTLFVRLVVEAERLVDQILVVTFTEAATSELRERVRRRLRDTLDTVHALERGETSVDTTLTEIARRAPSLGHAAARLNAALEAFDEAQISTIHGFCQRVLSGAAFESGVPFEAELVTDLTPLLDEITSDYWVTHAASAEPTFVEHLAQKRFGLTRAGNLVKHYLRHHGVRVLPEPIAKDALGDPKAARARFVEAFEAARAGWSEAETQREIDRAPIKKNKYAKNHLPGWFSQINSMFGGPLPTTPKLAPPFERFTSSALSEVRNDPNWVIPEIFERHEVLERARTAWEAHLAAELVAFQRGLLEYIDAELPRRKRALGIFGFDDLLQLLEEALRRPGGKQLRTNILTQLPAALIDEFQDTDPIQYSIFWGIYGEAPKTGLFLIGDPKQAIYSFRGADVATYMAAARHVPEAHRFTMLTNHRSDERLVAALNAVFSNPERPFLLDGIGYPEVGARHAGKSSLEVPEGTSPEPLQLQFLAGKDLDWTSHVPAFTASEIQKLLVTDVRLDGRPLSAGDIAVLTRTNKQAFQVQAELARLQIPSVVLGDKSIYETEEAAELSTVLAAVIEPHRGNSVKSALATRLFGVAAAEIHALEQDPAAWEAWLRDFRDWSTLWRDQGFIQMFHAMTRGRHLQARLLTHPGGERRLTNLLQLAELLHKAARRGHLGPAGLLHYLAAEREREYYRNDDEQIRLESDAHAVKLTTVHKAKGLEYPVVFCSHLWFGMLKHPADEGLVLFHDGASDSRHVLDLGTPDFAAHEELQEWEILAENARLLYVALTRARHRCHVIWGRLGFRDTSFTTSALGHVLHPVPRSALADEPLSLERIKKHLKERSEEDMLEDLRVLAARAPIQVTAVTELPTATPIRVAAPLAPALWKARQVTASIPPAARIGSFSSLSAHAEAPKPLPVDLPDHDAVTELAEPSSLATDADAQRALDLENLPAHAVDFQRGARAGVFFHALFEHWDFTSRDAAALDTLVSGTLTTYGYPTLTWREPLAQLVRDVLDTPLSGETTGPRLADIPMSARLNELEFHLPVSSASDGTGGLSAKDLSRVFREHPSPAVPERYAADVAELGFTPLRGLLKGYVDLVFRHEERWYVVDYKSNHLGPTLADYAQERLDGAMTSHHYYLQYHLYAVALHRYLRFRMPDYDYDRHFGGVYYLFLKGMTPASGNRSGVFYERPPLARIEALSRLFDTAANTAASPAENARTPHATTQSEGGRA